MHIMFSVNQERFKSEMLSQNKSVTDLAKEAGLATVQ